MIRSFLDQVVDSIFLVGIPLALAAGLGYMIYAISKQEDVVASRLYQLECTSPAGDTRVPMPYAPGRIWLDSYKSAPHFVRSGAVYVPEPGHLCHIYYKPNPETTDDR